MSVFTRSRCFAIPSSVVWSASRSSFDERVADAARRAARGSSRASSLCLSMASRIPKPNSALSSKSELDQAGPRPFALCVYGVVGRLPPKIDEQPVALAMIARSP